MQERQSRVAAAIKADPDVTGVVSVIGGGSVNPTTNVGRLVIELGGDVGVDVQCDAGGGVAEAFGHDLWVHAGSQRERGVSVAQVVQADHRQTRRSHQLTEADGQFVWVQRRSVGLAEDEVVVHPSRPKGQALGVLPGAMCSEHEHSDGIE